MLEFISLLWAGELLGVSFLATPIKFQATQYGATMPMLLGVGKVTFNMQNIIDMSMITVVIALFIGRYIWGVETPLWCVLVYAVVFVVIAFQSLILLPILDMRTLSYINGDPLPSSHHHLLYAVLEGVKFILLIIYPVKNMLFK